MTACIIPSMSNHLRGGHPFPDSQPVSSHTDGADSDFKGRGSYDEPMSNARNVSGLSLETSNSMAIGQPSSGQGHHFQPQPILPWSSGSQEVNSRVEISPSGRANRKNKAHTPNACNNCKRAHLGCDSERPCKRCTATGKQVSYHLTSPTRVMV